MAITDILITALVGMMVVFTVLVVLMCAIKIMAFVFSKINKKQPAANAGNNAAAPAKDAPPAPGSCGDLTLKNVSDSDAAMIMAIVADKLQTPLNELRFISIKKVEE